MGYQNDARKIMYQFLNKAVALENKEIVFLATKWGVVSSHLESLIQRLSEKEILLADQLFKLDLYKEFLQVSNLEVTKFNQIALGVVTNTQEKFAQLGLEGTQESIKLITVNFNRININAVNKMIGFASDGSPLAKLFAKSYPESVAKLTNTLITSQAMGYNPIKTARLLAGNMDGNLTRAITIARTEQMNCLRTTSIEQMKESGVVKGWIRVERVDACDECAELDGKKYSFEDNFETHPRCRGITIPDMS